jgi:hypothetical protein
MPAGSYSVSVNGGQVATFSASDKEQIIQVPLPSGDDGAVTIARR